MLRQGTRVNRIYILINTTNLTQPMTYIKTINICITRFFETLCMNMQLMYYILIMH